MAGDDQPRRLSARYSVVAILFHWVIAALILYQIIVGLWMEGALEAGDEVTRFAAYETAQQHKAIGLTVLALSLLRLAWRLANPAPPAPASMPFLERAASTLSHWGFYGLMIGMPLTGWAMVSTSPDFAMVPTSWFDIVAVPHLPDAPLIAATQALGVGADAARASGAYSQAHELLAYGAILLLAVHVLAALRHHIFLRDAVLARMVPGLSPRDPDADMPAARRAGSLRRGLGGVLALGTAALAASLFLAPSAEVSGGMTGNMNAGADAEVPRWAPIMEQSKVTFTGQHSGYEFSGVFERWQADIAFDPERLELSRAVVEFEVASARTGSMQYDGSLPSEDWLAADSHPVARFEADRFTAGAESGAYVAEGMLTLRGVTLPLSLPFTLVIEGGLARVSGSTKVDRIDFGVGADTDAEAAWVSREIGLAIELVAEIVEAPDGS